MPDIPTDLDLPTFIRIFIPGIIFSVIFSYAIFPIFFYLNWIGLELADRILLWIFTGIISGIIINCSEIYIYKFFEGLKFWPDGKRKERLENIKKNYGKNLDEFPFIPSEHKRYPISPTRLGNVMAEYETYSYNQYGIDMEIFWPHLRILVSKEIKDDIDIRGAKADFFVYMSFIFLIYALIGSIGFSYQLTILVQKLPYKIGMFIICFAMIAFIFLILSYIFYLAAIPALKIYGGYIKALFDLYRFDLAKKFECDMDVIVMESEIEWWKRFGAYLKNQVPPK